MPDNFIRQGKCLFINIYKYWRNRVQSCIKVARKIYYMRSIEKLKNSNPARWWKEVKASYSDDVRNCEELAENFNNFLTALTSHLDSLTLDENQEDLEVPNDYLVDAQQIYRKLRKIEATKSHVSK